MNYQKLIKNYIMNKNKNDNQDNDSDIVDEYGFCKTCTWGNHLPESHVEHNPDCPTIRKHYNITLDDDGEYQERIATKQCICGKTYKLQDKDKHENTERHKHMFRHINVPSAFSYKDNSN